MMYEYYKPQFERFYNPPQPLFYPPPQTTEEIERLIREFREAIDSAKRLDVLTKQPDCEDPEKAKLEERVAELERQIKDLKG
jgi:hypothetical protein